VDEPDGLVDGDGDPEADGDGDSVGDGAGAGAVAAGAGDFDGVRHCPADPFAADTATDVAGAAEPTVTSAD
jgi:hypothetical protein